MAVTAAQVKELREKTGAGIMDAKRALVETDGNMEAAAELLREKGIAKAAKKADRVAAEGLTGIAVNGNVAAIVELNSETDFVAWLKKQQNLLRLKNQQLTKKHWHLKQLQVLLLKQNLFKQLLQSEKKLLSVVLQ